MHVWGVGWTPLFSLFRGGIAFFMLGAALVWFYPLVSTIIFLIGIIFALYHLTISGDVESGVVVGIPSPLLTFLRKKRQKCNSA